MAKSRAIAFDCGRSVIGLIDIAGRKHTAYWRSDDGAWCAVSCIAAGPIVSFNGDECDLAQLSSLLGLRSVHDLRLKGEHHDMSKVISVIRWPPDPGTSPIRGQCLLDTYKYYFGRAPDSPPSYVRDNIPPDDFGYVESNWRDCHMAAELWKKWRRGDLRPLVSTPAPNKR